MKRIIAAIFIISAACRGAVIPVPVLIHQTNLTLVFPTNLWVSNSTPIASAVLDTLSGTNGQVLTIVDGEKQFATPEGGFDLTASYAPTGDTWDFTMVANLLLPPASVTMCCSNAFVSTDAASALVAVQATNAPQVLVNYSDTISPVDFYNIANGDFWAEGIGQTAASTFPPLTGAAVSSGTLGAVDPTANNQSVWAIASSTSANSGYSLLSRTTHMFFAGGEESTIVARFNATNTLVARGGFLDVVSATEPTDGGYWEIANGYIYGRTSSNSVRTSTATSNLLDQTSYYRIKTSCSTNIGTITFALIDASGTVLWTDSLSTNIPAASNRAFGVGLVAISTSTNATTLSTVDAVGFRNKRRLTR